MCQFFLCWAPFLLPNIPEPSCSIPWNNYWTNFYYCITWMHNLILNCFFFFFSLDHKLINHPKCRLLQDQNPDKVPERKSIIIVGGVLIYFKIKEIGGGEEWWVHCPTVYFSLNLFSAPIFMGGVRGMSSNRTDHWDTCRYISVLLLNYGRWNNWQNHLIPVPLWPLNKPSYEDHNAVWLIEDSLHFLGYMRKAPALHIRFYFLI